MYPRSAQEKILLARANYILFENKEYQDFLKSVDNWKKLTRKKICSICGTKGKTVLHHIDPTIRPKVLTPEDGILYIPARMRGWDAQAIVDKFLAENDLQQNTKYYNTTDTQELCYGCHAKIHSKLKKENNGKN